MLQAVLRPAGGGFGPVAPVPTTDNPLFEDARVAIISPNTAHAVVAVTDGKAIVADFPLRDGF